MQTKKTWGKIKPPLSVRINQGNPINQSRIGLWLFNAGSGTSIANTPQSRFNGILTSVTPSATSGWGAGWRGPVINFDGTDDYVNVPSIAAIPGNNFSIYGEFKTSSAALQILYCEANTADSTPFLYVGVNIVTDGQMYVGLRDGASSNASQETTGLSLHDGKIHSFAVTLQGTTITVYIDGVQKLSVVTAAFGARTINKIMLGGRVFGSTTLIQTWNGTISHIGTFSRVLSRNEVLILHSQPFTGLVEFRRKRSFGKATAAAAGGSLIKTIMGLAIASVKTINGLAIASVKTRNGLTNV